MDGSRPTPVYDEKAGEMVVYTDDLLDQVTAAQLSMRILTAFPTMKKQQVQLLIEMMIEEGFTTQRAKDAVNSVIKSYKGWDKNPNIANFIGFDKRVKVLTYKELNYLHDKGEVDWDDYEAVDVGLDKPRWAKKEDVQAYGLKRLEARTQTQA